MVELELVQSYCDGLLSAAEFDDYCPNGLQVDAGSGEIRSLVSGVTACQALIDAAVAARADLLLVHHGFFWRGEPPPLTGIKGRRVRTLMQHGCSLLAYHLPLDAHPELGNNRLLGERMGFTNARPLAEQSLIWQVELGQAESATALTARIGQALDRQPLHLAGGAAAIRRVGWCSGAAEGYIEQAAAAGLDAFISGEVSEQTMHLARELGIHYFSAGHHATERLGVAALGAHLAEKFGLTHQFIDIENPV